MFRVARVQSDAIQVAEEVDRVRAADVAHAQGGLVTFEGAVRGSDDVESLYLEHYPGMTEAALAQLAQAACTRWALSGVLLVHRVGWMLPGEIIVLVTTAAAHRKEAFESCSFLVDALKTDVPLWKKQRYQDGREVWVESRATDYDARDAWAEGKGIDRS